MKIYCLSGLGADERAFQFLRLPGHHLHHIEWISPLNRESMESYSLRIKDQIDISAPFALMGLSFGGMVAVELNKLIAPEKLILISSITGKQELPWFYRLAGHAGIQHILPDWALTGGNTLMFYFFGANGKTSKRMLKAALDNKDIKLTKWSIRAALRWRNTSSPTCIRIHGSKDRILPVNRKHVDYWIDGGSHLMILDRAREIGEIIEKELETLTKL